MIEVSSDCKYVKYYQLQMSRLKRLKEDGSHVPPVPPYLESLDILHPGHLAAAGRHAGVEEGGGDADPGVGGDHAEGAEQEDEEVLAVGRQRGHQPVHGFHLLRTLLHPILDVLVLTSTVDNTSHTYSLRILLK